MPANLELKQNRARAGSATPPIPEEVPVKVQASSLRKGNVVDLEGKLYVVLKIENIHPGKGTPVTQLDMRRISNGLRTMIPPYIGPGTRIVVLTEDGSYQERAKD